MNMSLCVTNLAVPTGVNDAYLEQHHIEGPVDATLKTDVSHAIRHSREGYASGKRGEHSLAAERFGLAISEYRSLAARFIDNRIQKSYERCLAECHFNRGLAYEREDDFVRAYEDYKQAILLDPDLTSAYLHRGFVSYHRKEYDDAIGDLTKAIDHGYRLDFAYGVRGAAWHEIGAEEHAICDLSEAILLNADEPSYYNNRAVSLGDMGNWAGALEDYKIALRLEPSNLLFMGNRGVARHGLGDYDGAFEDYAHALEMVDDIEIEAVLRHNRGQVLADVGKFGKALRDLKASIVLSPNCDRAYASRAWLLATCSSRRYRNGPRAVVDAMKACQLAPNRCDNLDVLAAAYAACQRFSDAIDTQLQAIDLAGARSDVVKRYRRRIAMFERGRSIRRKPKVWQKRFDEVELESKKGDTSVIGKRRRRRKNVVPSSGQEKQAEPGLMSNATAEDLYAFVHEKLPAKAREEYLRMEAGRLRQEFEPLFSEGERRVIERLNELNACPAKEPIQVVSGIEAVVDAVNALVHEKIEPNLRTVVRIESPATWHFRLVDKVATFFGPASNIGKWCLGFLVPKGPDADTINAAAAVVDEVIARHTWISGHLQPHFRALCQAPLQESFDVLAGKSAETFEQNKSITEKLKRIRNELNLVFQVPDRSGTFVTVAIDCIDPKQHEVRDYTAGCIRARTLGKNGKIVHKKGWFPRILLTNF